MLVSIEEVEGKLNNLTKKTDNIILIGMSGAGKTHWSALLSEHLGLEHIEFDSLIGCSKDLENLIFGYEGKDEAEKMGRYFGMPWTEGFQDREDTFLAIEKRVMEEYAGASGMLLDLTGSAIYHPEQMAKIAQTGTVIYLETSEAARQDMFNNFIREPKPVCWGGVFEIQGSENQGEALERCYPVLLETRAAMYQEYADIILHSEQHKKLETPEAFMRTVKEKLSNLIEAKAGYDL